MKNSNLKDWLIPLLVVFGLYVPLSNVAPSPERQSSAQPQLPAFIQAYPTVTPTPTPSPGPDRVPGEAAKLLCDFFGFEPDPDAGLNPQQTSEVENRRGDYCGINPAFSSKASKLGYEEIEYLIATVPDPKDTRLDHQFDRALDAIWRAIESAGYAFDRYWLPWDRSRTITLTTLPVDPRMTQMETRHLRDPGVILFRGSKSTSRGPNSKTLLLLFLVGETPTRGIHRAAFQKALQHIENLPRPVGSKTEKPLRILSPYFPGSAESLAILLKERINGTKEVRVMTGSTGLIDKRNFPKDFFPAGVNFQTTVVDASHAIDKFFNEYLKDLDQEVERQIDRPEGVDPPRPIIASLSEGGTGGGQLVRLRIKTSAGRMPVLSLTYPIHISQLRAEAAKSSLHKDVTKVVAVKDADLPLPMSEAGSPGLKDTPTLFSTLEPVTMDLSLREALTAIHRGRIRYVRVSASDPQDRLFLVREIRKHCPSTTIFMTSADLLYLHSEYNLDFQGVLVISSYPLFGLNQLWTYPFKGDRERLQFPTPTEQGVYNATLALLGKEDRMLEYGFPFKTYEDGGQRNPALWVGIVGRNGILPVKAFDVWPGDESYTMCVSTCPDPSAAVNSTSSAPSPSPTARSEFPPSPATTRSSHSAPRLGLSVNYKSPIGAGFLLPLGFICVSLSLILLGQLSLVRRPRQTDQADPHRLRPLARIRAWARGGWLGRVFGNEEFYRYRLDRRISVLWCCAILLTVSLFASVLAILPGWILFDWRDGDALQGNWGLNGVGFTAFLILVSTLIGFIWLMVIVARWLIGRWRHSHGLVWVLLALAFVAVVTFVIGWPSLVAYIWLMVIVGLWIIGRRPHFRGLVWEAQALVVGVAMIAFVGWGLGEVVCKYKRPEKVFFFLRASELTSGVSVLLPALLVGLAAFLSFLAALRRWNLAGRMPGLPNPRRPDAAPQFLRFDHRAKSFEGLKDLEDRVKDMIVCPIFRLPGVTPLTIVTLVIYWYFFVQQFIPSVDGRWFDWFFKLAFCIVPLLLVWAMIRSFWLWVAVKRLLQRLSWHPLISQYAAMRSEEKRFASLPPVSLRAPAPMYAALSLSALQARSFYSALKLDQERAKEVEEIGPSVKKAESGLSLALVADARREWRKALQKRRYSQAALAELTERVSGLLEDSWLEEGAGQSAKWQDEGKFFLITHIVAFLQHIFAHLQNLIWLVTMGLLLMLFAANFYPFQPRDPLLLFSWVAILTSVAVALYIFLSASRDKTLSLLAGTAPDKVTVTRDLVFRVMIYGVFPVAMLLGLQFPRAVRQIFSWLNVFEGKGG